MAGVPVPVYINKARVYSRCAAWPETVDAEEFYHDRRQGSFRPVPRRHLRTQGFGWGEMIMMITLKASAMIGE